MACPSVLDIFKQHTESFVDELRFRAAPRLLMYNLIERGELPQGEGFTFSTFEIGRSLPTTDEPAFEAVTSSGIGSVSGTCDTTYNEVPVGFFERTFGVERFGWKGPVVCQDDLIFTWRRTKFLDAYKRAMDKNVMWTIENRLLAIYSHFVPKAVASTSFSYGSSGTGTPGTSPNLGAPLTDTDCELTQEMLDATAAILIQEGATEGPGSDGWIQLSEQGPIFPLMIGMEQSARLLKLNSELRLDYRAAFNGAQEMNPIIRRLGASRVIGNFRHVIMTHPPRFNWNQGTQRYDRVPTWVDDNSATKGDPVKLNPDWQTATHEAAYVLSPNVFKSLVGRPVTSGGGGTSWEPKSYMGDWDFIIGGYRIADAGADCYDPREKLGRHFAEYLHAPEVGIPSYGRMIIFARCPLNTYVCVSCS